MVFQSGIRVRLLTASPIRRGFLRTRLLLAAPKPWESASLAVLRPQRLPVRESRGSRAARLGGLSRPGVGAVWEVLLARGRQAVQLAWKSRQHLALRGGKARPGDGSGGSGTRRRRLLRNGGRLLRNG